MTVVKHTKGQEFAIWCKSYSFAKRQHKAATSIKLSDRVGGVSAIKYIFGCMTLTTKGHIQFYCVGRYYILVISIYIMSDNSS